MKQGKVDEGITTKQMLSRLNAEIKDRGGQAELARYWGVSPQSISNAVTCAKLPSPAILDGLNLKPIKTIRYRYEVLK